MSKWHFEAWLEFRHPKWICYSLWNLLAICCMAYQHTKGKKVLQTWWWWCHLISVIHKPISLIHWAQNKMVVIFHTKSFNGFSRMKMDALWFKFSLKFVSRGLVENNSALVQIMTLHRPGDKPLSEPMMVSLLMHKCVTQPQWDKGYFTGTRAITKQSTKFMHNSWDVLHNDIIDNSQLIIYCVIQTCMMFMAGTHIHLYKEFIRFSGWLATYIQSIVVYINRTR